MSPSSDENETTPELNGKIPSVTSPKKGKKSNANKGELGEVDQRIKDEVTLLVSRTVDPDPGVVGSTLTILTDMLRTATGSVGSVPKPLKFVRVLFDDLVSTCEKYTHVENKKSLSDIISFISITKEFKDGERIILKYALQGHSDKVAQWGHEYMRFLAGEIAQEWIIREEAVENAGTAATEGSGVETTMSTVASTEELKPIVEQIMSYMMKHQDESAACDLAVETNNSRWILNYCDNVNYKRVALYAQSVSEYLSPPDNQEVMSVAYQIYVNHQSYPAALRIALRLNDREKIESLFQKTTDELVKKQMAFMCARYRTFLDYGDDEALESINGNLKLSEYFLYTATELDSLTPKKVEDDVYKMSLLDANVQSAARVSGNSHMYNLAKTFVNAFANCAFTKDELLTNEGTTWISQNKEHAMISATASLGLINLWDMGEGVTTVDRYTYSEEPYIQAGAYLATGIAMCGIKSPFDVVYCLVSEHVNHAHRETRICAILALGFAYAGMLKMEVKEILLPVVADAGQPLEVRAFAAYALALVYPASCDEDISEVIMTCFLDSSEGQLKEVSMRYMILALGALFIGRQEKAETLIEGTQALHPYIQKYVEVVVLSCAYAGSGNVLQIQKMLSVASELPSTDDDELEEGGVVSDEVVQVSKDAAASSTITEGSAAAGAGAGGSNAMIELTSAKGEVPTGLGSTADNVVEKTKKMKAESLNYKTMAVIGVALIAMGESYGNQMVRRSLTHVLMLDQVKKDETTMSGRHAVPLAYALLTISTPDMPILDALHKLSHDGDIPTAMNAILAMGLVSAGTNNARVATMLRNLTAYYVTNANKNPLFMVRLAQGLVTLGKGHLTLSPLQSDNFLISPSALVGLLGLIHSAVDLEHTIFGNYHYMVYSITPTINPRMVLTLEPSKDTEGELRPVKCSARVGIPVDIVAVPGKPNRITGFQTQSTPLLMANDERAQIVGKHKSIAPVIENIVIVQEKDAVDSMVV